MPPPLRAGLAAPPNPARARIATAVFGVVRQASGAPIMTDQSVSHNYTLLETQAGLAHDHVTSKTIATSDGWIRPQAARGGAIQPFSSSARTAASAAGVSTS